MSSCAAILYAMAIDAGLDAAEIDPDDVIALHAFAPYAAGIWVNGEQTYLSAMDEIAGSVQAAFYMDLSTQIMRMGQLQNEVGNSAATIRSEDIIDLSVRPDRDQGRQAWRVVLAYRKNYAVQPTDIEATVTAARRAEIAEEYRRVSVEDADIKTRCLLATEPEFKTLLALEADAETECQRRFDMYAVKHNIFDVTVDLSWWAYANAERVADSEERIKLLDIVTLEWPDDRDQTSDEAQLGGMMRLIGIDFNLKDERVTLSLWTLEMSGP